MSSTIDATVWKSLWEYLQAFCGLMCAMWNGRRILGNASVWSGNISESLRILDWETERLGTVIHVPSLSGNHRAGRRWEFSAEAGSRKPDGAQGEAGALTAGQHGAQPKWSFLTHPSKRKKDGKGPGRVAPCSWWPLHSNSADKASFGPQLSINQHLHLFKFSTQGWCVECSQRVSQDQKPPLPWMLLITQWALWSLKFFGDTCVLEYWLRV